MLKQYNQIKNTGVSLDCRGGVSLLRRSGVSLNCSGGVSLTGISTREVNCWIFSTVHTDLDDQHPVSGNRMFGITTNYDIARNKVSYTFFTRGADRPSGLLDTYGSSLVLKGVDMLWNDIMQNVTDDVNQNGGKAVKAIAWSKRVAW